MPVSLESEGTAREIRPGMTRRVVHQGDLMMVVIDFTDGPWDEAEARHSHPHVQTSYVAEGEIMFYCEGEPDRHLRQGDMYFVPPDKKHTVKVLSRRVRLIDSFHPLRQDFL